MPCDSQSKKPKTKQLRSSKAHDNAEDERWASRSTDIIILIMGQTGVGKSTFVNCLARREAVRVGHNLDSCTKGPQLVVIHLDEHRIVIVDTPGFDDSNLVEDSVILRRIADWLSNAYDRATMLGGVIYLHDITQRPKLYVPPKFLKLLIDNAPESVVLVTTKWQAVHNEIGQTRETRLHQTSWKEMAERGSQIMRFDDTYKSAKNIAKSLMPTRPQRRLTIQDLNDLTGTPPPLKKKNRFFGALSFLFARKERRVLYRRFG